MIPKQRPKINEIWKIEHDKSCHVVQIIGMAYGMYKTRTIYTTSKTNKTRWNFCTTGCTYTKLTGKELDKYLAKAL